MDTNAINKKGGIYSNGWVGPFMVTFWGWTFDLFDLFTILLVTPIISPLFFPSSNYAVSIAGTYSAFVSAYLTRPVGAAFWGNKSDKEGRKKTLIRAAIGLVFTAVLLGLLPTYMMVGVIAPALLIIVRIGEGFFVGGLTAGAFTIGPESIPEKYRGLMGGAGFTAAGTAFFFAALWFLMTTTVFVGSSYLVWGWRVMFFSGIFPLIVVLVLNFKVPESPKFLNLEKKSRSPVKDLFSRRLGLRKTFVIASMVTFGWAGLYYITVGFQSTYMTVVNKVPTSSLAIIFVVSSIGMMFGPLIGGIESQYIGRRAIGIIGAPITIASSFIFLILKTLRYPDIGSIMLWYGILSFFVDFGGGIVLVYLNEVYPTEVRSTGVSFTWNLDFTIGSFSPVIISTLAALYGFGIVTNAEIIGIIIIALIGLVGILLSKETKGLMETEEKNKVVET